MQVKQSNILPILRTDTQRELLIELFFESANPRTLTDLAKAIGVDQTTVAREVNRLTESGLIAERRVGRARTVAIDDASPLAAPLRQLIRVAYRPLAEQIDEHLPAFRSRALHERRPLPSSRRRR